jgi:hypothetical protein
MQLVLALLLLLSVAVEAVAATLVTAVEVAQHHSDHMYQQVAEQVLMHTSSTTADLAD